MKSYCNPGLLILVLCCLANGVLTARAQTVPATGSKTVSFAPFKDPWGSARERYWDIDDKQFNAFVSAIGKPNEFKYSNAQVTLTYDPAPSVPYFVGHITASGLKPNFAYQLKLTGKPKRGTRGWSTNGDDWSNEAIGYAGRWWCDSSHNTQTNFDDSHYTASYVGASPGTEHNIYGYLFMGSFITDEFGNANVDFTGKNSYHVDWKDGQLSSSDKSSNAFVLNSGSPFHIGSTSGYGYGSTMPNNDVTLWYEYEPGRAKNNVQLPTGKYNCRLLLTEESFHNTSFYGGYWKTVLATEDFAKDANGDYILSGSNLVPDSNANNDVAFSIGLPAAPTLNATAGDAQVSLSWSSVTGASSYTLKRGTASGGPYAPIAQNLTAGNHIDTGLTNGTTYFYVVVANNNAGEGLPSSQASATPQSSPPPPAPSAPQNLTAAIVSNQIDLNWSSVTGASSYTLKRGTVSGGPYQNLATGLATTQYTDTSAVAGTTYFYVVTAVGAGGESTPSNEANAILPASQPLTLAPSADAYVRAKNYAATNYGNAATLEIKTSKTTAENRDAYFKFDLNGIGTVTTAKLRIYASLYGTGSGTSIGTTVYSVSNTTWTENGLTWNNKPARGSGRASVNVVGTTYAWYELDVTSYIKSELAARRRIISLALHNSANSNLHIRANSKEATANRPQLVITN